MKAQLYDVPPAAPVQSVKCNRGNLEITDCDFKMARGLEKA